MCKFAWQLLGMLGNVLGRSRHASQRPRHAWQRPWRPRHAFSQGPRSPTSKKNPLTCCLINCEVKGVVYHQASICLGRCEACQGSCQAYLHILGSHLYIYILAWQFVIYSDIIIFDFIIVLIQNSVELKLIRDLR